MTKEEINKILSLHKKWLMNETGGIRANLGLADLGRADLRRANLCNADLRGAYIAGADLREANLRGANLREANLSGANLSGANLSGANLSGANLRKADLREALSNEKTAFFALQCPKEGAFIGFKKARGFVVKLKITEDAERSSATTRKCRCSKAIVLGIYNLDRTVAEVTSVSSIFDNNFIYEIGKIVEVTDFNEDRWIECTTGIHFFLTFEEAKNYES